MKIFITLLVVCLSINLHAQKKKKSASLTIAKVEVVDQPQIQWLSYETDTVTVGLNIQSVTCKVSSRLPLQQIEVKVNGLTTDVYEVRDMAKAVDVNKYEQIIERTITLRTGSNTVLVIATNNLGLKQESVRRVVVDPALISILRNAKDNTPPMIYTSITANMRDDRVVEYSDIVKIEGTIMDEAGVQSLVINNIVTPVKANGAFVINLPLIVGDNPIAIEAKDVNQNIGIKKFVIERKNMDGSAYRFETAKNHLVVIGINSYANWPSLYNAVTDAEAVAKVLTTRYKFEPENVTTVLNEHATRANIYEALRKQIESVSPRDNLVIYYSGHGFFDKLLSEGYWVPVDGAENDVSSFVPNSQILKIIENINSQHTFLVSDACFSGSLFATTSRGYTDHVEKYKSRWGLASGRLEKVSDGQSGTTSPFAESFIDFLVKNQQEKVAVTDLIQYVKKQVAAKSDQTPIGNPLKGVGDDGGEFVFYKR